jgi:hypothetical protein
MVKRVNTVKELKEALADFSDDCILIGSTVDGYENWYTYPVFLGKHPGAENRVLIQLKPVVQSKPNHSE